MSLLFVDVGGCRQTSEIFCCEVLPVSGEGESVFGVLLKVCGGVVWLRVWWWFFFVLSLLGKFFSCWRDAVLRGGVDRRGVGARGVLWCGFDVAPCLCVVWKFF
jgi:hypothetical protein